MRWIELTERERGNTGYDAGATDAWAYARDDDGGDPRVAVRLHKTLGWQQFLPDCDWHHLPGEFASVKEAVAYMTVIHRMGG